MRLVEDSIQRLQWRRRASKLRAKLNATHAISETLLTCELRKRLDVTQYSLLIINKMAHLSVRSLKATKKESALTNRG